MLELNQAVSDAIKQNLPSAVADELKQYIQSAQATQQRLERTEKQLAEVTTERGTLNIANLAKDTELNKYKLREKEFDASEEKVRTFTLDRAIAQAKLEGAMEVTRLVFSNTVIKKSVTGYGSMPVQSNQYGIQSGTTSEQKTETIEG